MAFDGKGKYHMSPQHAAAADKMPPAKNNPPAEHGGDPAEEHEPGSIGHHLQQMHAEHGGMHMHVHQREDGGHTTHHVGQDGKVEGPHEHDSLEAVKGHIDSVMGGGEESPMPIKHGGGYMPEMSGY